MTPLTVGALFAGYGGMEQGIAQVLPVSLSWFAEFDAAPSAVMAHHHPGVPNLGDVTKVDWSAVEPVDIITGGSPCQDLSHAGKRAGMKAGTRSGLWASMCDAIDIIRPRLVVWENVQGALSAEATSAMEQCPRCVGDPRQRGPVLRALGRVLGDLAELGYDARWYGLRAADVGGAHGRFRIFLFATPADARSGGWGEGTGRRAGPDAPSSGWEAGRVGRHPLLGVAGSDSLTLLPTPVADNSRGLPSSGTDYASLANVAVSLLPTPRATDGTKGGPNQRGSSGDLMLPSAVHLLPTPSVADGMGGHLSRSGDRSHELLLPGVAKRLGEQSELTLLPTPAVNDMGEGKDVDAWDAWTERMRAAHGNGNGHGKSLAIEAQRMLLPTPSASQAGGTAEAHRERKRRSMGRTNPTCTDLGLLVADDATRWGDYAPAIARWGTVVGRPAPAPTEPGAKGGHRLSARFVEWLMGVPEGWVCDVPGITRNQALKALGNGIVPQQCAAAFRAYLTDTTREAVA